MGEDHHAAVVAVLHTLEEVLHCHNPEEEAPLQSIVVQVEPQPLDIPWDLEEVPQLLDSPALEVHWDSLDPEEELLVGYGFDLELQDQQGIPVLEA